MSDLVQVTSSRFLTRVVSINHSPVALVCKVQSIAEEEGPHERQVLKLLQRDWPLEQLPLLLQREELVDELPWVREEVVVVVFIPQTVVLSPACLRRLLGIHQMPGAPITLHEPPCTGHIDGVPGISEPEIFRGSVFTRRTVVQCAVLVRVP